MSLRYMSPGIYLRGQSSTPQISREFLNLPTKLNSMKSQVFINLAVKDLSRSAALYTKMGFTINPTFSDESAKCLVWSEEIFLMIMTNDRFKTFTAKPLADTKNTLAGIFALFVDSFEKVNQIAEDAIKAGGVEPKPLQNHDFMQLRTIEDFDGHTWEIFFMDMSKFPKQ